MANTLELIVKGYDEASASLAAVSGKIDHMAARMQKAGAIMMGVGAAITAGLWKMTDAYTKAGAEIYEMSQRTGIGTESLSEMKYMAELTGSSLNSFEASIRAMQRGLTDASRGTGEARIAIQGLGISILELQSLSPEEQFWTLAQAIASVPDPTTRASLAMDIFGRSGTDLLPMLAEGTEGINGMRAAAERLGVVFTDDMAAAADSFQDTKDRLQMSLMGLAGALGETLMPKLEKVLNFVTNIIIGFSEWAKVNPGLANTIFWVGAALLTLGGTVAVIASVARAIIALNAALIILHSLAGAGGIAKVLIGLGIAAGAIAGMYALISHLTGEAESHGATGSFQYGGVVPGPIGQPVPIIAHGGERFLGAGGITEAGTNVTINIQGTLVSESDLIDQIRKALYDVRRHNVSLEMA